MNETVGIGAIHEHGSDDTNLNTFIVNDNSWCHS